MRIQITRPDETQLRELLDEQSRLALTYSEVGATREATFPAGFHSAQASIELGGTEVFDSAIYALRHWTPQRSAGMSVLPDGDIAAGSHVALATPLPIAGFALAACRVVYVEDTPTTFAFGYGTLPVHPESGEERFAVVLEDGVVRFEIAAFSRSNDLLAKLGGPVGRRVQASITERYLQGMKRACV